MPTAITAGLGADRRVVYLLGAGATQGAASFGGSAESLVMSGLIDPLLERMRQVYIEKFNDHPGVAHLVNDVIDANTDFEHLLTFLEDTPSHTYQDLAARLKTVFSTVLRSALENVREDLGEKHSELYAVLVDMHQLDAFPEKLGGFLTLNYDLFLEHAIEETLGRSVDYGVQIPSVALGTDPIRVLKLHGSFGWSHVWPIQLASAISGGLWIPPGIRKAKADYPFNAIWGAARDMLDCDVLRIIGCNLGPNDWDLVSLLFTTMHGRESTAPYDVEVIAWPGDASRMADAFPYLNVRSLLELPEVGPQFIGELLGDVPTPFKDLDALDRGRAMEYAESKIENPFAHWLRLKGELMLQELPTLDTNHGLFKNFVEAPI
jgi:hypothetical protein